MPEFKFKTVRTELRYPRNLSKKTRRMMYAAFSDWQRFMYPQVISECPVHKVPDPRRSPGFVRSHIKLVTHRIKEGSYQAIGVPGASVQGSPAWRAYSAILALHGTGARRTKPLLIQPIRKQALAFPLSSKTIYSRKASPMSREKIRTRGPKNWVVVKWVFQPPDSWRVYNPFIWRVFERNKPVLLKLLHQHAIKASRERGGKIVIG